MDKAEYGDVIYVDRGVYKHFGIYSGEGRKGASSIMSSRRAAMCLTAAAAGWRKRR